MRSQPDQLCDHLPFYTGTGLYCGKSTGWRRLYPNFPGRAHRQLARMHTVNMIGERIDFRSARIILQNLVNDDYLDRQSATLMLTALTDTSLKEAPSIQRDRIRADILKQMLLVTLK